MGKRGVVEFGVLNRSEKVIDDGLDVLNIVFDDEDSKVKLSLLFYYLLDKAENPDNIDELLNEINLLKLKVAELGESKLDVSEFTDFIDILNLKLEDLNKNDSSIKSDITDIKDDLRANNSLLRDFFKDLSFLKTKFIYISGGVLLVGLIIGSLVDNTTGFVDIFLKLFGV